MSLPFNTTALLEPTEEEIKALMAVVMQNSLMIQQLQLMVAMRQKEINEQEDRRRKEREEEEEKSKEEEKQNKLKDEEIRTMRTWSKKESRRYVEKFRGYREDTRCRKRRGFGHMAHHCRRAEIEAEREQRGRLQENRWKPLECRVMRCDEEREAAHSVRREAQQGVKCWGCGEMGHRLWTCPAKAACPPKGEAQQERRIVCAACKGENHITRNCDSYWRWRELNLREEVERTKGGGVDKESEGTEGDEGQGSGRRESGEVHNATSESSMDESGFGKGKHP